MFTGLTGRADVLFNSSTLLNKQHTVTRPDTNNRVIKRKAASVTAVTGRCEVKPDYR